jgi:Fe-S cluster assembly protein SufD
MSTQVSSPQNSGLSSAARNRDAYLSKLLKLAQQKPSAIDWVQGWRDRATAQVQETAFPTTRDEEWRVTDLSPLLQIDLSVAADQHSQVDLAQIADFLLPEVQDARLVFVNGVYAPELSAIANLPPGLICGNLSSLTAPEQKRIQAYLGQQPGSEEVFTALNTVGCVDAAIVLVEKNQVVEQPIHLLFISIATDLPILTQPRCLIVAEPNSSVTLVEDHVAIEAGVYLTNSVTEIWLAENAQVNHTKVQRDSLEAFHISKTAVSQARTSRYTCNAISLGARCSRHNLEIYQTGEQTETILNGLTMIAGEQLADTHSTIALTKPHGISRQLHKCIVDERAHAVFNGKVFVPKAAQLTDAGQLNRNLLLSAKARVDTKPQLEIVADNVKCSHGATVGQLDQDEIFYLQSRGIDAVTARNLLIYAFAFEVIDRIPLPSLQQALSNTAAIYRACTLFPNP